MEVLKCLVRTFAPEWPVKPWLRSQLNVEHIRIVQNWLATLEKERKKDLLRRLVQRIKQYNAFLYSYRRRPYILFFSKTLSSLKIHTIAIRYWIMPLQIVWNPCNIYSISITNDMVHNQTSPTSSDIEWYDKTRHILLLTHINATSYATE